MVSQYDIKDVKPFLQWIPLARRFKRLVYKLSRAKLEKKVR